MIYFKIPLFRFAKNLSHDSIGLSLLRGEGNLTNLELDENVLMDVLELPSWINLKKAVCNKVSVKVNCLLVLDISVFKVVFCCFVC